MRKILAMFATCAVALLFAGRADAVLLYSFDANGKLHLTEIALESIKTGDVSGLTAFGGKWRVYNKERAEVNGVDDGTGWHIPLPQLSETWQGNPGTWASGLGDLQQACLKAYGKKTTVATWDRNYIVAAMQTFMTEIMAGVTITDRMNLLLSYAALLRAFTEAESSGHPCSMNHVPAMGLIQVVTSTVLGECLTADGPVNPFHPLKNLLCGGNELRLKLIDLDKALRLGEAGGVRLDSSRRIAYLAAMYNAGGAEWARERETRRVLPKGWGAWLRGNHVAQSRVTYYVDRVVRLFGENQTSNGWFMKEWSLMINENDPDHWIVLRIQGG